MLKHLEIQNVVLIDKAEIDLSDQKQGLCILSGETGSGKSILLDAFGLAIGFRSNLRLIGSDQNKASVAAEFDISQNELCKNILKENDLLDQEDKNNLRIRRVIQENSSSKAYVNDVAVGINLLAQIGESLVEIHGQHDQRGLLNSAFHGEILDQFAGNQSLLSQIRKIYEELKKCDDQIAEFQAKKDQIKREEDYLTYVIKELETADIKENEEDELVAKKDRLTASEKILNFLNDLNLNLTEASSQLLLSQKTISRNQNLINNFLTDKVEEFEKLNNEIDTQTAQIDDKLENIKIIARELKNNDDNLEEIEERLFYIRSLARKFNVKVEALPQIIFDAKNKLEILLKQDELAHNLDETRKKLLINYNKVAEDLSKKRKKSAIDLAKKVEEELQFLKMPTVKFLVEITKNENSEYNLHGNDKIKFFASINKNNFDDIAKIASGGELSRFMLALKVALMDIKSVPTMIFDEIDTGIGGATAEAVGKRLKILSKNLQIFVVTHQAQIAAKADTHFRISKRQDQNKIKTVIEKLDKNEKIQEVARMISGEEITEQAIAAAKKLQDK